jgi:hypothetical protein
LDKKAHENRLLDEQMQREMDHNIQVYKIDKVALRLQAKQTIEKRGRLKNPGEGLPENILKYPISMQTTAMIYTSSVTTGERKRSKSATTTRQVPKVTRPMTGKARPQTSGSVLKLFESARMDYKHGEWKRAEDGLKELLSKVSQQGGPDVKNTKRMSSRPKSARPTRHSAFPVSSAFSECDSDGDADLVSDTELEKIFGEDVTREVVGKSTVPGLDSKRKQERSPSRAQSRPSSPKKKVVTIPQPQPVLKEEGKAEKPIVVKEKPLVASKVDKPVVAKEKPRAQSALKKEPAKVEKPVVKSVPQAVPKAEKPVVKEKATVKPVPSKAPKEQNEVTKPVPKAQEKVVETVDEDIPEAIIQEVKEKEPDVPIEDSYGDDFETEKVPLKDEKSTGNLAKEPTSKSNLSKSNPSLAHIDSNKSTQSLGRSVPDLQKSSGSVKNASKPVTPKSSTSQLKSQDKLVNKESVGKDVKKSSVDLKKSNQALARSVPELAKSQEPLKDSNETKAEPITETAKSSSNLKKSSPAIARSVPELSKSQEPLKDSKESKSEPTTEQVKSTSNLKKSNQSLSRSVPELSKSAKASQQKLGSQPALQKSTENVEKTSKSPEDPKEAVVNQEPETERKPSRPVSARQSRDQLDQSPIPVRPTSARQSQANLSDPSEPQKSNPELKKSDHPYVTKSTSKLSRSTDKLAPEGQKAVAMKSSLANLTDQSKKSQPDLKTSQYTFDNNGISKSVKDIYGVSSRKSSTKGIDF